MLSGLIVWWLFFTSSPLTQTADYALFYGPQFDFLRRAMAEGEMPFWNPFIGLGRPFFADMQTAVCFPPVYLVVLFGKFGLWLLVGLHFWLGAWGMRYCAHAMGATRWTGSWAALVFLLSAPLIGRLYAGQVLYVAAASYCPILLAMVTQLAEQITPARIGWIGALLAMQLLSGHPQVFWFTVVGLAAYVAGRSLECDVRASITKLTATLLALGGSVVWCFALAAVVLLPFLQLVSQGNRQEVSSAFSSHGRLKLIQLFGLFTDPPYEFQIGWEHNLFIGTAVLITGLGGMSLVRDRNMRGLATMAAMALLISFGDAQPLFNLLRAGLPGLSVFRIPARMSLLLVPVLALSAAVWLSRERRTRGEWRWLWLILAGLVVVVWAAFPFQRPDGVQLGGWPLGVRLLAVGGLVLAASWSWRESKWKVAALVGLFSFSLGELLFVNAHHLMRAYPALAAGGLSTSQFVSVQIARVLKERGLMGQGKVVPRINVSPTLAPVNAAMTHGYGHFDAYTSLFLDRPWRALHAAAGVAPPALNNTSLAPEFYRSEVVPREMAGVIAGVNMTLGELEFFPAVTSRAFLIYETKHVPDREAMLMEITRGFPIYKAALVEASTLVIVPSTSQLPSPSAVTITEQTRNTLKMNVATEQPGLLVLAEAWYPGWSAEVAGLTVEAVPVNGWMRAFPVPPGNHEVRVFFRQQFFWPGLLISIAALGLLAAMTWRTVSQEDFPTTAGHCSANSGPNATGQKV